MTIYSKGHNSFQQLKCIYSLSSSFPSKSQCSCETESFISPWTERERGLRGVEVQMPLYSRDQNCSCLPSWSAGNRQNSCSRSLFSRFAVQPSPAFFRYVDTTDEGLDSFIFIHDLNSQTVLKPWPFQLWCRNSLSSKAISSQFHPRYVAITNSRSSNN